MKIKEILQDYNDKEVISIVDKKTNELVFYGNIKAYKINPIHENVEPLVTVFKDIIEFIIEV